MKKGLYILFFIASLSFSQQEKENYSKISKEFLTFYNAKKFTAIFNLFDDNMKNALPIHKSKDFFNTLFASRGKITAMAFSDLKRTAHIYKSTFEVGTRSILLSLDKNDKINGLYISQFIPKNQPLVARNTTKMILPFYEEWTVFWGGTSINDNYHVAHNNQKYAYDLGITKMGKSYEKDRSKNENFYVFGKKIIAPSDATVVKVIKGVKDNIPGQINAKDVSGNTVILKTANNEFILFAHFKENSIRVMENQIVKQGDLLGLCGNSGNSSEPHLHLSLQNVKDMNIATGGKLFFENIKVNGKSKQDYIPIKDDKIQNLK